ncbi:MAG TPA: heme ABC exporter ATP-binding protein CcmA [Myxococcota bacterium]|nr:heme ABC exporter ATP-binding protein CcmA [Myxococcota bacterium]
MSAAVEACDLAKRFGRHAALRDIRFEVAAGSALAVLGANGAGKTTLLRLVAGLARPSAGTLTVGGVPATRPESRARIGYAGHATWLYPALTARENLWFAARLHGVADARERIAALLDEEALTDAAELPAGALSRGMAQRLSLARALVHRPALLLLDEPFDGLDSPAAERLVARLRALRAGGHTLLLVTHDPRRAAALCDTALVLARGRVAAELSGRPSADSLERALAEAA